MLNRSNIRFRSTCDKQAVLVKVRHNRDEHARMVEQARREYVRRAEDLLTKQLVRIREGKSFSLQFHLPEPQSYLSEYDAAIAMLEMHQDPVVILEAQEFRQLVQDDWDWTSAFVGTNAIYSAAVRDWGVTKGVEVEDV